MKKEKVVATLAMGVVAGGVAVGGTSTVHAETLDENTENTVQAPEETEAPADPETKEEAKDQLYANFFKALKPGGILFVGATEAILNFRKLGYTSYQPFFYQKPL